MTIYECYREICGDCEYNGIDRENQKITCKAPTKYNGVIDLSSMSCFAQTAMRLDALEKNKEAQPQKDWSDSLL